MPLKLGLYSPVLVEPGDRLPVNTKLVGFPIFESESGAENGMPPELERFLDRGPPPLVFTLGSFAVRAPGSFYEESLKAARDLGMRAVLLTGNDSTAYPGDDVLACRYAPHSQLFPRAAVIIHHGGIGTTGQALKAGKPELVVPHMGDQWDNGARIRRLGVGAVLGAGRYTAVRARTALGALCADNALRQRAIDLAARVEAENGAQAAAEAIARCLGR